ncbi:aly/REF export factor 2 [Chironomus tepperi]|uniref:aly/REF export factor 2 n=1 Tax=Chironomus tepperi TaxID=113505 RepID=UPI00391FA6C8
MKMDKIEMSLDDIIKSNKKRPGNNTRTANRKPGGTFKKNSPTKKFGGVIKGRGGRGGITRNNKYTRGDVNSAWKHDMYEGARKTAGGGLTTARVLGTTKLIVGNLDFSVSDTDINELFQEFGPLKTAAVHYDRSGRSLGSADVIFERRNDALKAMKTYNGVPLDGRPMNIQLATSEVPQAGTRLGFTKPATNNTQRSPRKPVGGGFRGGRRQGGFSRGRGGSGAGRGGGRGGPKKTEVTLDQLNAELDAYTMQG